MGNVVETVIVFLEHQLELGYAATAIWFVHLQSSVAGGTFLRNACSTATFQDDAITQKGDQHNVISIIYHQVWFDNKDVQTFAN